VRSKNRRVLDEDRRRIGTALKSCRQSLGLHQKDIAQKGRVLAGTFSVGTVQNIEYGRRRVTREKIELYAKVVGTTFDELLNPHTVQQPTDSQFQGLNREHLDIARRYRDGLKNVRTAVEWLLADDPLGEVTVTLAELMLAIKAAAERDGVVLDAILVLVERRGLLSAIARRLEADPLFEDRLRALLNNKTKQSDLE